MTGAVDTLARGADSLRRATEALFLAGAQFGPVAPPDSLQTALPAATAADLYGAGSVLHTAPLSNAASLPALGTHPLFQLLVLLLAAVYALLLYRHATDIRVLFARSTFETATSGRATDSRGHGSHARFRHLATVLGVLLAGTLAVKGADTLLPPGRLPAAAASVLSLGVAAALAGAFLFSAALLRLIGAITLTQETTAELIRLKRSAVALLSVVAGPFVLFYALSPAGPDRMWVYLLGAEALIVTGLFLTGTMQLFLRKKIPILHWFLYLCTVELFPLSLMWLLVTRQ